MKIELNVKCECETKTPVVCKPPGLFKPTVIQAECHGCKSDLLCKISKNKGNDPKKRDLLGVQTAVTKPSKLLLDIRAEEKAHREAEVDG